MQISKNQADKADAGDEFGSEKNIVAIFNAQLTRQRWMALGLLLAVMLVIFLLVIMPVFSMSSEYSDIRDDLMFRLQRYQRIIASKDTVLKNAEKIKKQYQQQGYFRSNETAALASADLQKFIKQAISAAGGQLTSTQSLPSKDEDAFTRITVKVRMTGTLETLRSVLYDIETATPVIIIQQLDIRPVRGRRNRKTRKIEPSNKLNINFQAASFMRLKS